MVPCHRMQADGREENASLALLPSSKTTAPASQNTTQDSLAGEKTDPGTAGHRLRKTKICASTLMRVAQWLERTPITTACIQNIALAQPKPCPVTTLHVSLNLTTHLI